MANGAALANGHAHPPPTKVWIDCDPGTDDAQALLMAVATPNVKFVGLSCVHGNVPLEQVLLNIARILKVGGREDIPVYRGCSRPWIGSPIDLDYWHGLDGLGDVPEVPPVSSSISASAAEGHACAKLVEAAVAHKGELVVVAIGPLTNIAMACQLDPEFPNLVKQLVVMGGAEEVGNITPSAEFNFYADPEAAQLVLHRFSTTTIVTWEATLKHSLPWSWFDQWLAKPGKKAKFMAGVVSKSAEGWRADKQGSKLGWTACDPMAVAVALRPDLVLERRSIFCDVELDGRLTRGMSVFDWNGRLKKPANVELVRRIDMERFTAMMDASLD